MAGLIRKRPPATRLTFAQREDVLAAHEPMAWKIAGDVRRRNLTCDIEDLASEARAAFVRCAASFDPSRGFVFATYAYRPAVRAALIFAAAECARGVHVPQYLGFVPHAVSPVGYAARWDAVGVPEPADDRGLPPGRDPDWWDRVTAVLPERWRRFVILHYRDGMSQKEIGRLAGMTANGVHMALKRALAELRECARPEDLA